MIEASLEVCCGGGELQDSRISLISFTPKGAYDRFQGIKDICDNIRKPDPDNIKVQIRPAIDDFEIFIKRLTDRNARYQRHKIEEFDPTNKLPPFVLKEMPSEEVQRYMDAADRAISDAEKEAAINNPEGIFSPLNIEDVPFMVVTRNNKRKESEQEKNNEAKQRREKSPVNGVETIETIHLQERANKMSDEDESDYENGVTLN